MCIIPFQHKCSQYWPNESKYYGDIQVMQIHKEDLAEFRILTFLIRKSKVFILIIYSVKLFPLGNTRVGLYVVHLADL